MRRPPTPLVLFAVVLTAYLANGRTIGAGDTLPARYLPFSVLGQGALDLDRFPVLYDESARHIFPLLDGLPYYLRYQKGHYISAYPPGPGVLAAPIYAMPVLLGATPAGWASGLEKLSAAIITALSVVLFHAAVRRLVGPGWSLGLALIYGLGTSSLSISSQGLWQHGPSQLFLTLVLYWLVRGLEDERFLAYTGFAMVAAAAMRVTDVLLLLPVAAWISWTRPRLIPKLVLCALPPAAAMLAYNLAYVGSVLGQAGQTQTPAWALFSQVPLGEGLAGILVSPGRGLFVYSPVLLFSIAGCAIVWRRGPAAFRTLSLGLPLLAAAVGKWFVWWGGHTWGPRLLADAAPVLCFFLYPLTGVLSRRPFVKAVFIMLAMVSIVIHALGAVFYEGRWDGLGDNDDDARLWSLSRSPIAFYCRDALSSAARLAMPVASRRPTSANSPDGLAAAYQAGPIPSRLGSGEPMTAKVRVTNTGRAVWLASVPGDRGSVRLGWRWFGKDREEPGGRGLLSSDVAPGQMAELTARVTAPTTPGDYTLVIDMVSELVTWFAERGSPPVKATVTVVPFGIERLLSTAMPIDERTTLATTIATDRSAYPPDVLLELRVTLAEPGPPRSYDAYLVLERPDAPALIFDGREMSPETQRPWPAWVKGLPLPARAVGRFVVPLSGLGVGRYRWSVVLTAPGTYRPVTRASTEFTIGS
jgi:hypothetical protein